MSQLQVNDSLTCNYRSEAEHFLLCFKWCNQCCLLNRILNKKKKKIADVWPVIKVHAAGNCYTEPGLCLFMDMHVGCCGPHPPTLLAVCLECPYRASQSHLIRKSTPLRLNRPSYTCGHRQYNPYNPWHEWLTIVVFVTETINHRCLSPRFLHEISPNENLYCSHCCTGALFWLCSFNLSVLVI